jgi:hypothetical protein
MDQSSKDQSSKQIRIHWSFDEKEGFITRATQLLAREPSRAPLHILREAMLALPESRRRQVISLQAYQPVYEEILRRAGGREGIEQETMRHPVTYEEDMGPSSTTKPLSRKQDSTEELSVGARALAHAITFFFEDMRQRLDSPCLPSFAQPAQPERSGPPQTDQVATLREEFQAVVKQVNKMQDILLQLAREFGVRLDEGSTASHPVATQTNQPPPIPPSSSEEARPWDQAKRTGNRSHAQSFQIAPSPVKKISILVIGPNGKQAQHIRKKFQDEAVALSFAESHDAKALNSDHANVVVWTKFSSHATTSSHPGAKLVSGGLRQLQAVIREVINECRREK